MATFGYVQEKGDPLLHTDHAGAIGLAKEIDLLGSQVGRGWPATNQKRAQILCLIISLGRLLLMRHCQI